MARLTAAADGGDPEEVGRIAHQLKSGCAQVGALALSKRLAELERTSGTADPRAMRSEVREVAKEFPGVVAAIERRRARPTDGERSAR